MEEMNCNNSKCSFNTVKNTIDSLKFDLDIIKKTQDRFDIKQDRLIDAISNHKAIIAEIAFIRDNQEKQEDRILRFEMQCRDNNILLYKKINELEKDKADVGDIKETRSWVWIALITVSAFLLNKLWDVLFPGK